MVPSLPMTAVGHTCHLAGQRRVGQVQGAQFLILAAGGGFILVELDVQIAQAVAVSHLVAELLIG